MPYEGTSAFVIDNEVRPSRDNEDAVIIVTGRYWLDIGAVFLFLIHVVLC